MKSTSTWFALRNPVFFRLFLASVLSGTVVSAQDMAATWVMHDLGASSFSLSLMATAASAPYFLFTLPAGVLADIVDRRLVIVSAALWQGACAALLALGAWTQVVNSNSLLACIFALGIGLALGAPVWGAIVPDIVSKDELSSAVTLGGVQLNVSTIVGSALAGFLLPRASGTTADFIQCAGVCRGRSCHIVGEPLPKAVDRAARELHRIVHQFVAVCSTILGA